MKLSPCPDCGRKWVLDAWNKRANSEWISVKDRLPEKEKGVAYSQPMCLVVYQGCVIVLAFNHQHECWDDSDLDDYYCDINEVSHWMPLPEPPKEG